MKLCVIYANCQGSGLEHFLRKTPFIDEYDIVSYQNYRLILKEQSSDEMIRDAQRCDLFLYQPTGEIYGILGTGEICRSVLKDGALRLSFSYVFNTGVFPIVFHGKWWTGASVIEEAKRGTDITLLYDTDALEYDCYDRFYDNLSEQNRREQVCDIRLSNWMWDHYKTKHLFLLCNHPTSHVFVEMARQVLQAVRIPFSGEIPITHCNEANLPGFHSLHPAVKRELDLKYDVTDPGADSEFFRKLIVQLQEKRGEL